MGRVIPLDVKGFTRMKISEEGINSRFNVKSFFRYLTSYFKNLMSGDRARN